MHWIFTQLFITCGKTHTRQITESVFGNSHANEGNKPITSYPFLKFKTNPKSSISQTSKYQQFEPISNIAVGVEHIAIQALGFLSFFPSPLLLTQPPASQSLWLLIYTFNFIPPSLVHNPYPTSSCRFDTLTSKQRVSFMSPLYCALTTLPPSSTLLNASEPTKKKSM